MKNYIQNIKDALAEQIAVDAELLDLYTLVALLRGKDATNEDIHDAWAVWRNNTKPDHKSLVPFKELTQEVQDLDTYYTEAIKSVAPPRL